MRCEARVLALRGCGLTGHNILPVGSLTLRLHVMRVCMSVLLSDLKVLNIHHRIWARLPEERRLTK